MQFLLDLWQPILLSGLLVFIVSALCWTVLPNHKKEFRPVPNEDAVMAALDAAGTGRFVVPYSGENGELYKTAEGRDKVAKGPIAYITIAPRGMPDMNRMMIRSAIASVCISAVVAYLAWHTVAPGADGLHVMRVTGTATFMSYALGWISESVWFSRPWTSMAWTVVDSLLYGITAGLAFAWLWP